MKKSTKGGISLTTLLIIGIIAYLLLKPQNAQAATTDTTSDSNNSDNESTGNKKADEMLGIIEKDKKEEAAVNIGKKIGEYGRDLPVKYHINSVREGWQGAIEIWKDYQKATGDAKKKYKNYVGYVILACNEAGGRTFTEAYNHLCSNHGDICAITTGYEWGNVWNKLSATDQACIVAMNNYAKSNEYVRWYQEMD